MVEPIVLILALVVAVLAALTVFSRNPISSAFSLVIMMVALAAIYGVSGAHFISALQAIVYAGAIMVLFVFSIMLLNMNDEENEIKFNVPTVVASVFSVLLFLGLGWVFYEWQNVDARPLKGNLDLQAIRDVGGNVVAVSGSLFSSAYIQFEFISLLLLVAIASALVLAKRKVD
ncbi:MAG: NADH-quinone oxidoreductase subunit J [Proteobacteria bacterium]|nr:MAG: NADH-quinone oxidoreductase subunit J [Pseudomonadota bacterium]